MYEGRIQVSEEQVFFYEQNGYVQLLNVLTPEELADVRRSLDEVAGLQLDDRTYTSRNRPEYEKIFVQKVNLWRVHEGMRRYVLNPKVADLARQLSRARRVRLWHDHALVKMPGDSKPSAWHQDLPYWPMQEEGALSCWMALDDVDVANGCMQFLPGTHLLGRLPPVNLVNPQELASFVPAGALRDLQPRIMAMPAGSCTFHNGLTLHYASANSTDRPRRAMITIYMPDDIHYTGKRHVVTDPLGLTEGAVLEGELFPVLAEG